MTATITLRAIIDASGNINLDGRQGLREPILFPASDYDAADVGAADIRFICKALNIALGPSYPVAETPCAPAGTARDLVLTQVQVASIGRATDPRAGVPFSLIWNHSDGVPDPLWTGCGVIVTGPTNIPTETQ